VPADAGANVEAERVELLCDDVGRADLAARDFGMAMEIAPQRDEPGLMRIDVRGDATVEIGGRLMRRWGGHHRNQRRNCDGSADEHATSWAVLRSA
jgi:hypothetical protein